MKREGMMGAIWTKCFLGGMVGFDIVGSDAAGREEGGVRGGGGGGTALLAGPDSES
jgi:hypothetical protein